MRHEGLCVDGLDRPQAVPDDANPRATVLDQKINPGVQVVAAVIDSFVGRPQPPAPVEVEAALTTSWPRMLTANTAEPSSTSRLLIASNRVDP